MFNAIVSPQLHIETWPYDVHRPQREMGPGTHAEGGQTERTLI